MTTIISGSSPSITFSDSTTQSTTAPSTSTFGFKNRIINGGMTIDQRNAGTALTVAPSSTNYFGIDRYQVWANPSGAAGTWTWQQLSATPPSGFTYYGRATVTTPDSSITGADYYSIQQPIEGYNLADFDFGTANAKPFTVSFWVRASLTGTFSCTVNFGSTAYGYPLTYTINSANTWEFKTINFPAITNSVVATISKTNGVALYLIFSLGMGSNYTGASGTLGSLVYAASGTTNLISTNGATLDITGVQLEVGTQATSFDFRDYGSELILCQRYFQKYLTLNGNDRLAIGNAYTSTSWFFMMPLQVSMRASPSFTLTQNGSGLIEGVAWYTVSSLAVATSTTTNVTFQLNMPTTAGTATQLVWLGQNGGSAGPIIFLTSEL